jgi:LmbE family N-acetylglucosaminyl deacetylase
MVWISVLARLIFLRYRGIGLIGVVSRLRLSVAFACSSVKGIAPMATPEFVSASRLMLVAPHPDDEALACSIILQRAVRAGAAVRVIYATDGDDNPWPQRVLERKWRLNAADRKRWGNVRRSEALAALRMLGVHARDAQFLALPDQGITNLLKNGCRSTVARLSRIIHAWSPTHLLVPSIADTHPDHNALAVMLRLVLEDNFESRLSTWTYAVHGKSIAFFSRAHQFQQSETEEATKLRAILCHKTQIKLSRRRFLAYATRAERLLKLGPREATVADGSIRSITRKTDILRLSLQLSPKLVRIGETALFLLGRDATGAVQCLKSRLPVHSCKIEMSDCSDGQSYGGAHYRGNTFTGEFVIPIDIFSSVHALFVKLERRSLFFDEAGWLEIPGPVRSRQIDVGKGVRVGHAMLAIR